MRATRISRKFAALKARNEAALIPFIVSGDPSIDLTEQLVVEIAARGADIIELGVPFSDPMADGPANQRALSRGLSAGASLPAILNLVSRVREKTDVPIVLFGYYNPFMRYGCERLCGDAAAAGVDGILALDLPLEESSELLKCARAAGLNLIFLLAPTTPLERSRKIAKAASGFLYYVSVTGITGARAQLATDLQPRVTELKQVTELPVGVGFGISTPEQAHTVSSFADAVVVGSAISLLIENNQSSPELVRSVGDFIASLKGSMRGSPGDSKASAA